MVRLVSARIFPSQLFQAPRLPSIRPPLNSTRSAAGSGDLSFRGVNLSNRPGFVAAALEAPNRAPRSPGPENRLPSEEVIRTWCNADAVCFDVDSTVCLDEGIDELADFCGSGPAVAEWTAKAMTGSVAFEDALGARLSLFKPSLYQVNECIEKRPPRISPGIAKLINMLRAKNVDVYLVSGGFGQMIKPEKLLAAAACGDNLAFPTAGGDNLQPEKLEPSGANETLKAAETCEESEARVPNSNSGTMEDKSSSDPLTGVDESVMNIAARIAEICCADESYVCFARDDEDKWLVYGFETVETEDTWEHLLERFKDCKLQPEVQFF